jgi:hypothetical protein
MTDNIFMFTVILKIQYIHMYSTYTVLTEKDAPHPAHSGMVDMVLFPLTAPILAILPYPPAPHGLYSVRSICHVLNTTGYLASLWLASLLHGPNH